MLANLACSGDAPPPPPPQPVSPSAPQAAPPAPIPAVTATAYDEAFIQLHLARVQSELGCGAPTVLAEFAHLCLATSWPTGTAAPLPGGQRVLLGVTTWVATTGPLLDGLARLQRLSSLALRTDAGGTVGEIMSPNSRSGDPAPQQAMQAVVQALRGSSPGPLPVTRSLFHYLSSRPTAVTYPVQRTAQGWQLGGGSFADVRRVGSVWVAIEVPRNHPAGLYLSLFVDNELVGVGL